MRRTTIRIDDELLARVKAYAALHHRSLNSVVEDSLRQLLHRQEDKARHRVELPTSGGGVQPDVDLSPAGIKQILQDEDVEHFLEVQRRDASGR